MAMRAPMAVVWVLTLCTVAIGQVGFRYDGIDFSQEQAYIKKASAGDVNAAYKLGFTYSFLMGHQNYAEAVKWLSMAAEKEHAEAEWVLGQLYSQGHGVEKSPEKAAEFFVRSAEHGSSMGQVQACTTYRMGRGVAQDLVRAFSWCKKAAEQGNSMAELMLGQMYQRGTGVEMNELDGQKWIAKAAAEGFAPAQEILARLKSGSSGPPPGAVKGGTSFTSVVQLDGKNGDPVSQAELKKLLETAKLSEDPAVAAALYENAAKTSASPMAWFELARLYEQGKGVPKDDAKALDLLRKAAKQEYVLALYRLGQKYSDGDGVPQDNTSAYTWFALAAKYGSDDGKAALAGTARHSHCLFGHNPGFPVDHLRAGDISAGGHGGEEEHPGVGVDTCRSEQVREREAR